MIFNFFKKIVNSFNIRKQPLDFEIILKASEISNQIKGWLSDGDYTKVSLGENCNSAWYLKETGNKEASYPYDWIFSSGEIIAHTIKDEFKGFLDRKNIFQINENKAGHSFYHSSLFNHKNPLKSDEDFKYYERTINRFLSLLKDKKSNILFVCTVIQEEKKRPGWANGFDRGFQVPVDQNVMSFTEMIEQIKRINKNVKFIFINQKTERMLSLKFTEVDSNCLWLDFNSLGKNSGVKYLNNLDDTIMKIIYKGMN